MDPKNTPPPHHLLAVYGTLAPGCVNYHRVKPYEGQWARAWIRGTVQQDKGYPVFSYDPQGPELEVQLLQSTAIDWAALDAFEGNNYRRILVPVRCGEIILHANIYAWAKSIQ